jgi:hypothetical protein
MAADHKESSLHSSLVILHLVCFVRQMVEISSCHWDQVSRKCQVCREYQLAFIVAERDLQCFCHRLGVVDSGLTGSTFGVVPGRL